MIDAEQTRAMLLHVATRIIEDKDLLTEADKMGDGDHGVGMARGFEAVTEKLKDLEATAPAEVLQLAGTVLMTSVGGAAGAIFGTLFRGGAVAIADTAVLDGPAIGTFLAAGLEAVKKRGGARIGDKTVVDGLEPAAVAAGGCHNATDALTAASSAATAGMESTRGFPARIGKMKTLGDRTLGHADPGAVSLHLILRAMAEYARALPD